MLILFELKIKSKISKLLETYAFNNYFAFFIKNNHNLIYYN